jgi:hypothetical protein
VDTSDTAKELVLGITRSHADIARAAYQSRDREVALLKAQIQILEHRLAEIRAENIIIRGQLRHLGGLVHTDGIGDSR